jgi:hypothetical protein
MIRRQGFPKVCRPDTCWMRGKPFAPLSITSQIGETLSRHSHSICCELWGQDQAADLFTADANMATDPGMARGGLPRQLPRNDTQLGDNHRELKGFVSHAGKSHGRVEKRHPSP